MERYFQVSLLLALVTAFLTLASTGRLDAPAVVLVSAALLARLASLASGKDHRLQPRAVTLLAACYLVIYPLDIAFFANGPSFLDRTLAATVHLVLFVTIVKVFSASTDRDYTYLAILSFLMMLAAAILTVGAAYLAGFCLYLLFAISALMSYEVVRPERIKQSAVGSKQSAVGVKPSGHRWPGFSVTSLRKRPLRSRRAGSPSDCQPPAADCRLLEGALARTTLTLALALIPVAAALFFLIPRYRSAYWTQAALQGERITGFSETVDLGDLGKILRSNQVMMRVTVDGDPRRFEGVKWRGVALSSFDGRRWSNHELRGRVLEPSAPDDFRLPPWEGSRAWPESRLTYRILLAPVSIDVLFAAGRAREIRAPLRVLLIDQTSTLRNPQHVPASFPYEAVSDVGVPPAPELREVSGAEPTEITKTYLELPSLDARIPQLTRQITVAARNNYDRTLAIRDYLQRRFTYALDLSAIAPADPLASFLFESKRGNCEYFAAAMAVMLRTLGIPTRLVNGFEAGSYNPVGKDFVVRGRDAHSWVEVYFPRYGWLAFDPTPASSEAASGFGLLDDYLDAAALFWNEWVINYDFGRQLQLAGALETASRRLDGRLHSLCWRFESVGAAHLEQGWRWLARHRLAALALLLIFLALATLAADPVRLDRLWGWLSWRFALGRGQPSARTATLAYHRFLEAVGRRGFRKAAAETPLEFAAKLEGAALRQSAMDFTMLYQALRFGHQPVSPADLDASLRAIGDASGS